MQRRKYTSEFKEQAVRMAQRGDAPIAQVARDLGINENMLYKWIRQFGNKPEGTQITPSEHEELIRLRRENRILKEERDILKKAAAYFAKEQL